MDQAKRTLNVLIVDDSEDDVMLTVRELRQNGYDPTWKRVDTAETMTAALEEGRWDLVISDHQMPHFDSLGALETLTRSGKDIPFIIVSGMIGEDIAVLAMKSGADDYLRKDNLKRLVPAIERELVEADIRNKKRIAEDRLQKSEVRYRMLFERMLDSFALLEYIVVDDAGTADFLYLDLNSAYAADLGMEREAILGRTMREVYPQVDETLVKKYAEIVRTGVPSHFEYYSESSRRHFEISAYCPRPGHVATIIQDITARKVAAERQELMGYVLETINRESDTQTIIQDIVNLIKHHFGFDAVGMRLRQNGDFPYYLYDGFSDDFIVTENTLCRRDDRDEPVMNEDGGMILECLCGLVLTGRTDVAQPCFTEGGSFWSNDLARETAGRDEVAGTSVRGRCLKEGYKSLALIPLRSGEETVGLLQLNSFVEDMFDPGLILFFESVGLTLGIALKRRRAEEAVRESEEKHRTLFETMAQGVVYQEVDGAIVSANLAAARILGLSVDQLMGRTSMDPRWKAIHEDGSDFPGDTHPTMAALRTGRDVRGVIMGVFNPELDAYRWISINAIPRFRPGEDRPYQVYTTFTDITDLKQAEQQARYQLQFLYIVINAIKAPIFFKDMEGRYNGCNTAFEECAGHPLSEILGKTVFDLWPRELADTYQVLDLKLASEGGELAYEVRLPCADGSLRDMIIHMSLYHGRNGSMGGIVGVMLDITERKKAEEALRDSQERITKAFRAIPEALVVSRISDGTIIEVNDNWYNIFGYRPSEMIGRRSTDLGLYADNDDRGRAVELLRSQGFVRDFDIRIRKKSGELRLTSLSIERLDISGEECMITTVQDITDRRRAEEAVRESERFALNTVNALDANIAILDDGGEVISVNRSWRDFALGNGGDDANVFEGANYLEVCDAVAGADADAAAAARFAAGIRTVMSGAAESHAQEYPCHSPDERRWFVGTVTRFTGEGPVRIVVAHTNITERVLAEEKIAASLREKEVLLKEIHHRVKNNMQVISSLIGLQNSYLSKGMNVKTAMEEMQNRIKSMAIVHEKLYRSENFARIDFRDYIASLSSSVFQSLSEDPGRVALRLDVKQVTLDIDLAVPCGLLVNELVTNALKHGFPRGRTGAITLTMEKTADGLCRISVRDDGVGLPPGFDLSSSGSLGLRLVGILTKQIAGTLEIRNTGGAEFIITFPLNKEEQQHEGQ